MKDSGRGRVSTRWCLLAQGIDIGIHRTNAHFRCVLSGKSFLIISWIIVDQCYSRSVRTRPCIWAFENIRCVLNVVCSRWKVVELFRRSSLYFTHEISDGKAVLWGILYGSLCACLSSLSWRNKAVRGGALIGIHPLLVRRVGLGDSSRISQLFIIGPTLITLRLALPSPTRLLSLGSRIHPAWMTIDCHTF